ncbi:apiosidase-like domain-containing protein [Monashia sp. NPDC004114]
MQDLLAHAGVATRAKLWHEVELTFQAAEDLENPYLEGELAATFVHEDGLALRRPAFWDGGRTWRVRFAPPQEGAWSWTLESSGSMQALASQSGVVECAGQAGPEGTAFLRHGFWRMSSGGRSLTHADGTAALLVADTAWALPWRATRPQVELYADDRAAKGFNAALLMTVQPDMRAVGPRDRTADEGFDVGFEDLADGRLTRLNPDYFQTLDGLVGTLAARGIAAVLQPVFHGFGWKGLGVAGTVVPSQDYARYCRYLVARYGARPVIYLVGADGTGLAPQPEAGGREVEAWDCYEQPTGLHYAPHAVADAHQDAAWLDFQWCQTGHGGEHIPERVADMARNRPVRAVANGEPTYERTGGAGHAEGWWQGHEAWANLFAGGTMGVVYGAASLWQWRLHQDEPGHAPYFLDPDSGWREALDFRGSVYVGLVGRVLDGLPVTDMVPDWTLAICPRVLRAPSGHVLAYQEHGGALRITDPDVPLEYRVVDPLTGDTVRSGHRASATDPIPDPGGAPRIYISLPAAAGAAQPA